MPNPQLPSIPPGIQLVHTLQGHRDAITALAWSPDGSSLFSASRDKTIIIWNPVTGEAIQSLKGHSDWVTALAATPDGRRLFAGERGKPIKVWNLDTRKDPEVVGEALGTSWAIAVTPDGRFAVYSANLNSSGSGTDLSVRVLNIAEGKIILTKKLVDECSIALTPDGRQVLSYGENETFVKWDLETGKEIQTLRGHRGTVKAVAVTSDGHTAYSGSKDRTIKLWDLQTGRELRSLEGHTGEVDALSLSFDSRLLASKSGVDDTVRLWQCHTGQLLGIIPERGSAAYPVGLAFHPKLPVLATLDDFDKVIRLWSIDTEALLNRTGTIPMERTVQYANAKIVLVGDSGVGKSGLGLVLIGEPFQATESTHGRHVRLFETQHVSLGTQREETRETLLWDLAGQPGYRLIHQLHLSEAAVALVVFDSRSETDPFGGVRHWARALRQAIRVQGDAALPMKVFLIAARADRGGIGVSRQRMSKVVEEHGFDGLFETSAREGWQIQELIAAIRHAIDWDNLPRVSSNELFQKIKEYLITEKKVGRLLATAEDLYYGLLKREPDLADDPLLRTQFETCIGRVEARDLIRRLKFGNLILLQPELLDAYASALVNCAKDEPDGLGCLAEGKAQAGEFRMSKDERIPDPEQEKLLLIATIEDLLRHEIALREQAEDGAHLVFPTQFTRDWENAPDPPGKAAVFMFEGPILNIYATLAVRLSHSGMFERDEMWRNAAAYKAQVGGRCGIYLREFGEGRGELTLFFDEATSPETRFHFEEFVHAHLRPRALGESIQCRRTVVCPACREPVPDRSIQIRRERGHNWIACTCDAQIPLDTPPSRHSPASLPSSTLAEMDRTANAGRDRAAAALVLAGKIATNDFDVFLCHHSKDKPAVKAIGERLKELGILPWLDEWELRPGLPWQKALQQQIRRIKSATVFFGPSGTGSWQDAEVDGLLQQFVKRKCPVIPVMLADCKRQPKLPVFLEGMTWVDFRQLEPDPLERLVWGITGQRGMC